MSLHFIHIGKTGGSAVKEVVQSRPELGVVTHPHEVGLRELPPGTPLFFTIRHPVDRFVSGFNSRLRRGRPRNDLAWSDGEARAFTRFSTPNALAEALTAPAGTDRAAAEDAMHEIEHARPLTYWLGSPDELAARTEDVVMICNLSTLNDDFARLANQMGWPGDLRLTTDPVQAHVTPDGFEKRLSETGQRNLLAWYGKDVELYGAALLLRAQIVARTPISA